MSRSRNTDEEPGRSPIPPVETAPESRVWERPRILFRESLENVAAVCDPNEVGNKGAGDPLNCFAVIGS